MTEPRFNNNPSEEWRQAFYSSLEAWFQIHYPKLQDMKLNRNPEQKFTQGAREWKRIFESGKKGDYKCYFYMRVVDYNTRKELIKVSFGEKAKAAMWTAVKSPTGFNVCPSTTYPNETIWTVWWVSEAQGSDIPDTTNLRVENKIEIEDLTPKPTAGPAPLPGAGQT